MCLLVSDNRLGDVSKTIIAVAQVIIQLYALAHFQQVRIILRSLQIIALGIFLICINLGNCNLSRSSCCCSRSKEKRDESKEHRRCHLLLSCLYSILNVHYCNHSRFVCLVHVTGRVAWRITLKLAFIQSMHEFFCCLLLYVSCFESLNHIFARKTLHRHIHTVTHVAPQSTEHFVIEFA